MQKNTSPLFSLFITVFIDMLGIGLIIPIFAPLIIKNEYAILPALSSEANRNIIYGFLTATYTIFQFFGAPILGSLADKFGRKKILQISLFGTLLGYIIFALAIHSHSLFFLFVARALPGFTGGNVSIIYAAIADVSDAKNKARNFGLIGMAFGLGFILGPFFGGLLCDPTIVSWFDYSTPLWFTAILTVINLYYVQKQFPETFIAPQLNTKPKFDFFAGLRNLSKAWQMTNLRNVLIVLFFQTFGFAFFMQFYQVYLIHKFNSSPKDIGIIFGYVGVWLILTQGFIQRFFLKNIASKNILKFSMIGLSLALLGILYPQKWALLFLFQPFIPIFQGLTQPNITSIVSTLANKNEQGEILGIQQSIQSLAVSIPPIIAGFLVSFYISLPILIAAFFVFIAWIWFALFCNQKNL